MDAQMIFQRIEQKYLLSGLQYEILKKRIGGRLVPDQYGESTVRSLYFDTPDHRMVRQSLGKPVYKEKLRLRSYCSPAPQTPVFAELKKKYKGVVYKRRIQMPYEDAREFLLNGAQLKEPTQISREISRTMEFYQNLAPAMMITYDRTAFVCREDENIRMTFDRNILWREDCLELRQGIWGAPLLFPGQVLLEIKIPEALPLWLSRELDALKIYPTTFSKYGSAYLKSLTAEKIQNKGEQCYA